MSGVVSYFGGKVAPPTPLLLLYRRRLRSCFSLCAAGVSEQGARGEDDDTDGTVCEQRGKIRVDILGLHPEK